MKILALEFSSPVRAVAVSGGPKPGYAEERGRSAKPFALIDAALREAAVARAEIECIAVGLGPGSNAGIRTAIAIAQGWQLACGTKLLGISSAEVVAALGAQHGSRNPVFVGLEARKGELWIACYDAAAIERPRLIEPFRLWHPGHCTPQPLFRMDAAPTTIDSDGSNVLFPTAELLARLATNRIDFVASQELQPVNLHPVTFVKAPAPRIID